MPNKQTFGNSGKLPSRCLFRYLGHRNFISLDT